MSYEEMEYLNNLTAQRRAERCRRDRMGGLAIQWGGWAAAAAIIIAELAVRVM